MGEKKKILIIEDEIDLALLLRDFLSVNNYEAYISNNGLDVFALMKDTAFDLIILDINLPDTDGIRLCQKIRQSTMIPIIMLSARMSDADKVIALGFGADDYMTKPFSTSELLARINAHLRRMEHIALQAKPAEEITVGEITINEKEYTVTVSGKSIELSAKEFELLLYLARGRNRVFTKEQLWDELWGYDSYGDINTVTVYIHRLREKLESDPANPRYIKTVWGVGYKLSPGETG